MTLERQIIEIPENQISTKRGFGLPHESECAANGQPAVADEADQRAGWQRVRHRR